LEATAPHLYLPPLLDSGGARLILHSMLTTMKMPIAQNA
jgi:hypothetical protein